jgi:Cu-Zn family superoxide dismutase
MIRHRVLGALSLLAAWTACSDAPDLRVSGAWVDLINTDGVKIGEAQLAEREGAPGVTLRLQAWSLPAGIHGFHIHDSARCDSPEFGLAGGHFNPTGKKHGLKNPDGPHAGDLPNLIVPDSGKVDLTLTIPGVTLKPGPNSLLKPDGTSLVIHADADDEVSDPAGNSGRRIACGVIRSTTAPGLETR